MNQAKLAGVLACAVLALLASGCGGKKSKKGGGGTTLPSIGAISWNLQGGSANFASLNGGWGGGLMFTVERDVILDNGARPTLPSNENIFDAFLGDGVIDWAEISSLAGFNVNAGAATLTVPAGNGALVPAGMTLDLSDAPPSIWFFEILTSDRPIIVRGTVLSSRTGENSLDVTFGTSLSTGTGVEFTGHINADADIGRRSSLYEFETTSTADIVFTGTGNLRGGAGAGMNDAGNGGHVEVRSGRDLFTRIYHVDASGGHGGNNGGLGGFISMTVEGDFNIPFVYGLVAHGGDGVTGNGGHGGYVETWFQGNATLPVFSRVMANGGSSDDQSGGSGGAVYLRLLTASSALTGESGGVLYLTANGGASQDSLGGTGGSAYWTAETMQLARLVVEAQGGNSHNGTGGQGGGAGMEVQFATDVRMELMANGGNGGDEGGRGGGYYFYTEDNTTATSTWTRVTLDVSVNGGNGGNVGVGAPVGAIGGTGNIGNNTDGGSNTGPINSTDLFVYAQARGGAGSQGGDGGGINFLHLGGGTMNAELRNSNFSGGHANGSSGTTFTGGIGGRVNGYADNGGTLNLHLANFVSHGGNSFSNDNAGGAGQLFIELNDNGDSASGSANVTGNATGRGGDAPGSGSGGEGFRVNIGEATFGATGGNLTLNLSVVSTGGNSIGGTGGNGGWTTIFGSGDVLFNGTWTTTGGAGNTDGDGGDLYIGMLGDIVFGASFTTRGGGTSGDGGDIELGDNTSDTVTVTAAAVIRTLGAETAGSAGDISLDPTDIGPMNPNLDVEAGATIEAIDGDGTPQPGNITED